MLEWKQINGSWYCYKDGTIVKGWIQDENKRWYYLNPANGMMATGWTQIDSRWYYSYTEKTEKDGDTHYVGEMANGWTQIDSRWYYLYTEKTEKDGDTHYVGEMANGWIQLDSRWYYLYTKTTEKDSDTHYRGEMATGWTQIDAKWYYLYIETREKDGNTHYRGEMATGWIQLDSIWYYLYTETADSHYKGEMAVNTTIDGWIIDSSGVATLNSQPGNITDTARCIYSFFVKKGWTSNSICAMLGNMQGESGIVADMNEVGGGGGYGLVQWTPKSIITNWANQNGLDYRTVDTQCKRIQWELENGQQFFATRAYPMNFGQFTQSTADPTYLAEVFINNYERPYNPNQPQRGVWAENWYNTLAD
ncbi:hypothetical protein B0P06_002421 [Clostridium saccharoperbutylacetonicum]|uniref:Peptidoglycan-binding domain 1 protein n=1 Tax=Clostridium saccharoperbutylacetonicum N1-4(HMT) TaxID=931276 RepID=M1MMZ6_9CLOT|nr:phage tail tip lysozyme [Clostridium saccharoperbutylacetonicum]AGF59244.1 peptidoglycan-binding domain 1 protein [Clostridium saccharoperbutylacetonicum N1-4(HMT)]NRT59968.1 hypothetical protein [Clostridium saccharoperbutylacetonicum]NSB23280.1 hypothetical protein [Clostridium saccharoperbutylacetonicum]NSB42650.1 hypothetical protein [Clostridium saccharoperbutylacetonicum]